MGSKRLSENRRYGLTRIVGHLRAADEFARIFSMMEERGFLIEQALDLDDFQHGSRDLEAHVLPLTVSQKDWQRFLRYTLVTMNLRGLAELLAEEEILRPLVQHGSRTLATHLAAQLTDSQARARARAVILGAAPTDPNTRSEALRRIVEDLDQVAKPSDSAAAKAWGETLCSVARHLGPELHEHWRGWTVCLAPWPALATAVWQAVAESWIERDLSPDSGLWEAVAAMNDRTATLRFLPRAVAASAQAKEPLLDHPLPPPLAEESELLWCIRVAVLGRRLRADPATVADAWTQVTKMPVPWSKPLVEAGWELWQQLGAERIQSLAAAMEDPTLRIALRVAVLEDQSGRDLAGSTLRDLAAIPATGPRLHWSLRLLATQPDSPQRCRRVRALGRYLHRIHDRVDEADLARFLDLVAESLPWQLRRQVEKVVWAPGIQPTMLRTLAADARNRQLVELLLDHAEPYAAAVSPERSEGFMLRCELMIQLVRRLCCEWGDLASIERAAERLLPDEEDQLRMAVVKDLLAVDDQDRKVSFPVLARVCGDIRSRRLRLLARLRITSDPSSLKELLAPASLYEAMASTTVANDERLALAPLLERPEDPASLADQYLRQVGDIRRRIIGLIDLARHAVVFQRRFYPRDRADSATVAQSLAEAFRGLSSREMLVALTPAVVAVMGARSTYRAVAEIKEAIVQILQLDTVDRSVRLETLEILITGIAAVVLREGEKDGLPWYCRHTALLLHWVARLPSQGDVATAELRDLWPELLPILVSVDDLLPVMCRAYLWRPLHAQIWFSWFPTVTRALGVERVWIFSRRLEKLVPRWLLQRLRTPWAQGASGFAAWMEPDQEAALEAYLDEEEETLRRYAEAVLSQAEPGVRKLTTLVYLLASRAPDLLPRLLTRLPDAGLRDALCLRLIRHRPLPAEWAWEVAALIDDPRIALRASVWLGQGQPDGESWLEKAALSGCDGLDPVDPRQLPLHRVVWETDRESACSALARATIQALARGGRPAGEKALRLWMHAYLAPQLGDEHPHRHERSERVEAAIRQAQALANESRL